MASKVTRAPIMVVLALVLCSILTKTLVCAEAMVAWIDCGKEVCEALRASIGDAMLAKMSADSKPDNRGGSRDISPLSRDFHATCVRLTKPGDVESQW